MGWLLLLLFVFFAGSFLAQLVGGSFLELLIHNWRQVVAVIATLLLVVLLIAVFHKPEPKPEGWAEREAIQKAKQERDDEHFRDLMKARDHLKKQGR
ncbi:MAG: hypothetical protein B9S33_03620 [Pedosphaera sp. Tous-C6FEB]|nr:MAG: hypothetical protein B9S33_03620 [Pedosphaera sp. Tous-C6FEB]